MDRSSCAHAMTRMCQVSIAGLRGSWRRVAGGVAVMLVALSASATVSCAATIGISMIPPVAFTQMLHDRIAEHAKSRGVDTQFVYAPEGAGAQQVAQIRAFIAAKVDALLVMPVDAAANATITRLAQEADIPLVYINSGPREDWFAGRVAFVLPNDLVAGRLQMRKLAQMLDGTGSVAIVSGHPTHDGSILRTQGVKEVMKEFPDLRIVAEGNADWDRVKARNLVAGWLAQGLSITAIAANNDEMAIGAAEAVEAAGIPAGRILIGGVDATADGIEAMQRKRLAVTIHQDAAIQGRRAVDDALALARHEAVTQYDWAPFELVTDRMSTAHFAR
ncbi:monosaccharide ABC transporter substrate-binding protein, CUT2 family [Methylobacterium phyllostachyos]|uniref:Monosaccharide ABC transporter substrate-binding protein, CUT2 family n=1 Tax=Methylobacterium phyllostachyos TaxID=582672 RepID=A0A1G9VV77_9HYPH|nr:substrate-binding domain-containing protein [Methylobacterium phyllostachyos]SDM76159.1 monosaccharide ABC transporter substrate-binding protein, CUT2 family [Methylobacterium phyllostachyos]